MHFGGIFNSPGAFYSGSGNSWRHPFLRLSVPTNQCTFAHLNIIIWRISLCAVTTVHTVVLSTFCAAASSQTGGLGSVNRWSFPEFSPSREKYHPIKVPLLKHQLDTWVGVLRGEHFSEVQSIAMAPACTSNVSSGISPLGSLWQQPATTSRVRCDGCKRRRTDILGE